MNLEQPVPGHRPTRELFARHLLEFRNVRPGRSRKAPPVTTFAETRTPVRDSWERLDSYLSVLGSEDAEILRSDIASLLSDARPADGRMARSHQTRRAIVDAMRALHAEGDLRPTAPRVAARAGLEAVFAAELGRLPGGQRKALSDALQGVSIWAFWDSLRTDVGLSPQQAREAVVSIIRA